MTRHDAQALDATDPLAAMRERFALPEGVIYLDGNSLGALPRATGKAVADVVDRQWGEDLITSWNKHGWIDAPATVAAKLARLIGAAADEVLVCDSTSINLFKLLAAALAASPGRTVILSERGNFPTDLYIAEGVTRMLPGVEVRAVDRAEIAASLDDQVAVLMLTHVDYRSGERHNMAALSAAARAAGALSLWDLSHSAGALDLSLSASGADLAVGCGYKYLNGGPGAPAFLYVAAQLQDRLQSPLTGWMGHDAPFAFDGDYRPAPGIARFLAGTPPIIAVIALAAGLSSFDGVTMREIEAKAASLTDFFITCVEARCPSVVLVSPRDAKERGSHISFRHPQAYAVMQALIERKVIGDVRMPNLIRFGFAPLYNRHEDAFRAATVLGEILDGNLWNDPRYRQQSKVI
ncbi:MAG: kynureninase [Sphingomonas bacterium]|nr:kynureninase [Sphingomonas bacterium]